MVDIPHCTSWSPSGHLLVTFWSPSGHLLVVFQQDKNQHKEIHFVFLLSLWKAVEIRIGYIHHKTASALNFYDSRLPWSFCMDCSRFTPMTFLFVPWPKSTPIEIGYHDNQNVIPRQKPKQGNKFCLFKSGQKVARKWPEVARKWPRVDLDISTISTPVLNSEDSRSCFAVYRWLYGGYIPLHFLVTSWSLPGHFLVTFRDQNLHPLKLVIVITKM